MTFLIVSGTGTEVGKTVVTAAIVANALQAEQRVAVVKPAQTGVSATEKGDLQEVQRLTGVDPRRRVRALPRSTRTSRSRTHERTHGVWISNLASPICRHWPTTHDLVVIEGAGGLLVRFDDAPTSLADLAVWLAAPVLLVVHASLGTLEPHRTHSEPDELARHC